MVSLLVKILGNQITLLLIVGIDLIIHINRKIFLKPLLPLLSMIKMISHMTNDTSKLSSTWKPKFKDPISYKGKN